MVTSGGALNNNAKLTLNQSTIASTGIFNVGSSVSTNDFASSGVININSGGSISNAAGNLYLTGGSRSYVNTGGSLTTPAGTTIELNASLLVNNASVSGPLDINFGSLATGTGSYTSVSINPGGTFAPGGYGTQTVPPNTSSTTALIQPAANGINTTTSAALAVTADTFITVNGSDVLTLSGGINAIGHAVEKNGTGNVVLAPFNARSLDVFSGKMQLSVTNPVGVLVIGSLSVESGTLDVGNNAADISTGSLPTINALLASGFANGLWKGAGITSSSAANDAQRLTSVGAIQNNQSGIALFTASNKFEGITPGAGDLLLKYTYYGDTNLDGKVDGSDYSRIDSGYLTAATGWFNGDFNYDGVINGSDYTLIDNAFNRQGANLTAELAAATSEIAGSADRSAVPEPASIVLNLLACMGFLGGTRSRRTE